MWDLVVCKNLLESLNVDACMSMPWFKVVNVKRRKKGVVERRVIDVADKGKWYNQKNKEQSC